MAMDAMQQDPATGRHTARSVVVAVPDERMAENVFAHADVQGFVVQLPRLV
jgi:hypothetical protein